MRKAKIITRSLVVAGFIGAFVSQIIHLTVLLFSNTSGNNSFNFDEGMLSQALLTFSAFCFFVGIFAFAQIIHQKSFWEDKTTTETIEVEQ